MNAVLAACPGGWNPADFGRPSGSECKSLRQGVGCRDRALIRSYDEVTLGSCRKGRGVMAGKHGRIHHDHGELWGAVATASQGVGSEKWLERTGGSGRRRAAQYGIAIAQVCQFQPRGDEPEKQPGHRRNSAERG